MEWSHYHKPLTLKGGCSCCTLPAHIAWLVESALLLCTSHPCILPLWHCLNSWVYSDCHSARCHKTDSCSKFLICTRLISRTGTSGGNTIITVTCSTILTDGASSVSNACCQKKIGIILVDAKILIFCLNQKDYFYCFRNIYFKLERPQIKTFEGHILK